MSYDNIVPPEKLAKPTPLEGMGDLRGTIYDFAKVGDLVVKHNHTEDNVHITIVAKGVIKIYSHDWEVIAPAGKVVDFKPNQPHEFMAMEDDTRIVNIVKKLGGLSNDYADVQQAEHPATDTADLSLPQDMPIEITHI